MGWRDMLTMSLCVYAYKEVTSQGEKQSVIGRLFPVGPVMARVVEVWTPVYYRLWIIFTL